MFSACILPTSNDLSLKKKNSNYRKAGCVMIAFSFGECRDEALIKLL
jgi:hypothetical protein